MESPREKWARIKRRKSFLSAEKKMDEKVDFSEESFGCFVGGVVVAAKLS